MTQRRTRVVTVRDHMQEGYRYEPTASPGRDFHPDFQPELTPKQMLALGVFCGKYMTDCRNEFPAAWFARAKLSPERRDCSLNYFGVMPVSHFRCGARRVGSIPTTPADGFNGIAATTSAGECQKRTRDRSGAGRRCVDTWRRSNATANTMIRPAESARGRPSSTGPMTAERSDELSRRQSRPRQLQISLSR